VPLSRQTIAALAGPFEGRRGSDPFDDRADLGLHAASGPRHSVNAAMDESLATRVAENWARRNDGTRWAFAVDHGGRALELARASIRDRLVELVADDDVVVVVGQADGRSAVLALAGEGVFAVWLDDVREDSQHGIIVDVVVRRLPFVLFGAVSAASSVRSHHGPVRRSTWTFATKAGTLVVAADVVETHEPPPEESFARALAGRLGWTVPTEPAAGGSRSDG
jgi:hypothetical protein